MAGTLTPRSQGRPRPEIRLDEMSDGVPAPSGDVDSGASEALRDVRRAADGTVSDHRSAAILGQLGGRAKAAKDKRLAETPMLARGLGLRDVSAPDLLPYLNDAAELAQHESARLARVVGGGECGTAPSVIVASAALQIAGSRYAFAKGDVVTGSRLADAARANLLAAHELCAREAQARPAAVNPLHARILSAGKEPTK